MKVAVAGSLLIVADDVGDAHVQPGRERPHVVFENLAAAVFVVIFGFLFVTVSSRIAGLIGTSANPISRHDHRDADGHVRDVPCDGLDGARLRRARHQHRRRRLHRGGERRGHVAGPEDRLPRGRDAVGQQMALMLGVMVSVFVIGVTLMVMNFGLEQFRAYTGKQFNLEALRIGRRGASEAVRSRAGTLFDRGRRGRHGPEPSTPC